MSKIFYEWIFGFYHHHFWRMIRILKRFLHRVYLRIDCKLYFMCLPHLILLYSSLFICPKVDKLVWITQIHHHESAYQLRPIRKGSGPSLRAIIYSAQSSTSDFFTMTLSILGPSMSTTSNEKHCHETLSPGSGICSSSLRISPATVVYS